MKKINKGLILTIIVVIALSMYIRNLEKQRENEMPEIKEVCQEFITFIDKYSALPEEMQKLGEKIPENELEEYLKEMKAGLESFIVSNEDAVNLQYQAFKTNLIKNNDETILVKNQSRTIVVDECEFNGDKVTVKFNNKLRITVKYLIEDEEVSESKTFWAPDDEIVLQKIEGEWKIVYSNLQDSGSTYFSD